MSQKYDRHIELINDLIKQQKTTCKHLAYKFQVSVKTIKKDIAELSYFFPICTFQGRGGGVKINSAVFLNGFLMKRSYIEKITLALQEYNKQNPSSEIEVILDLMQSKNE